MKTNDFKKGVRVKLRNGWEATIKDNQRGNIRMCEVYGIYTEMGSVYSHDIVSYQDSEGKWNTDIEYTKSQNECAQMTGIILD